jgi:hypothetical protein
MPDDDHHLAAQVRAAAAILVGAATAAANAGLEVTLDFDWIDTSSLDKPSGMFQSKCTVRRVTAEEL